MKKVVIVGGGFAGLNAAIQLGNKKNIEVLLIDRRNHHLFQPLLYQVAMSALSPSDIAAPIRSIVRNYKNIRVLHGSVASVDTLNKMVMCSGERDHQYDYLVMACGAQHVYFGNNHWEKYAPGLKTVSQAIEIRSRVLRAFENAEREEDKSLQKQWLTFVIVGGGATGVELAGALGEMSRHTLDKDFRRIDPKKTRIFLVEGGDHILSGFDPKLTSAAHRALENQGVQIWTNSIVTDVDEQGVRVGEERILSKTVLWAAGVKASELGADTGGELDNIGRVIVEADLSLKAHPEIFVLGDQSHFAHQESGEALPGLAPVAKQQGQQAASNILADLEGKERKPFTYKDFGTMATIGRNMAIAETGGIKFSGYFAWVAWLFIHIYFLIGYKNRIVVMVNWIWSYLTQHRGARLIVGKKWRFYADKEK